MRTSLHLWRSLRGKPTNIFCCVWKELHRVGVLARPPRGQKWAIAHAAPLSPTSLCPRRMKPASMMRPNARASPSGNRRDHGQTAIMRHTTTAIPMVNFRPIGIGPRPRWTSQHHPRYRSPICMNPPWIPHCPTPPCMRTHHRPNHPCMRNRPQAIGMSKQRIGLGLPLRYRRRRPRPCPW